MRSWSRVMPALATSTSTGPCASSISPMPASTDAVSRMSPRTPSTPSGRSPPRWMVATRSPAATKASATARPLPRLAQVPSTLRASAFTCPPDRASRARYRTPRPAGAAVSGATCPAAGLRSSGGQEGAGSRDHLGGATAERGRPRPDGALPHLDGDPHRLRRRPVLHRRLAAVGDGGGRGAAPLRRGADRQRRRQAPRASRYADRGARAGGPVAQADVPTHRPGRRLPAVSEGPEERVCSAKGCRQAAEWALQWNNPRLHTAERRKTWLACADHREHLETFLGSRSFLREVLPVADL